MGGRNSLFHNDGSWHFTDVTAGSGFVPEARGSTTAALADVDGDGDLDLYIANYKARTMLDSLSPQERAFDQIVRKVGESYQVIPSRQNDYRVQIRDDLRGVSLIQRSCLMHPSMPPLIQFFTVRSDTPQRLATAFTSNSSCNGFSVARSNSGDIEDGPGGAPANCTCSNQGRG